MIKCDNVEKMGKKKRKNQNNNSDLDKKSRQKKKVFSPSVIIGSLAVLALVIYFIAESNQTSIPERQMRISPYDLIETRPVLSPAIFHGRTALAYQYAAEIPEVLDNQFCYCYCRTNFNHKTLLTCFTDDHGANCSICQNEVFRANQLYKKGLSINEIAKRIDKEFYRKPS